MYWKVLMYKGEGGPTHNISHLSCRAKSRRKVLSVNIIIRGRNVLGTLGQVPDHAKFGFFFRCLPLNIY